MEQRMNTVTISIEEYKSLIIAADRANRKEKEIKDAIEAQKDEYYRALYEQKLSVLERNSIEAQASANTYHRRCLELEEQLGKIYKPKKHWWNIR